MSFFKQTKLLTTPKKAFKYVMDELSCPMREAQRYIDKGRLSCNGELVVSKSSYICGEVTLVIYKPITKGLKPIFQTNKFAIFDKPSGMLVHPKNRNSAYTLTDEVKYQFGLSANLAHRIDKETSGLVLAAKDRETERRLKEMFQKKLIKKGYLALVKGKIDSDITIEEPIRLNRNFSEVKIKVVIDSDGKYSKTVIKPIKYYHTNDTTLVEAIPYTGRQHQIRAHLFHMKHPIVGDPIYGVDFKTASDYLDGILSFDDRIKKTGSQRLMLHANWIEFKYDDIKYKIYSKQNFTDQLDN